jgi:glycosyltransferase involved in cell wall biosynthesis
MKVLHVLSSLEQSYGGPLRAILDMSARGSDFGVEAHVVGPGPLDVPDNPLPSNAIQSLPLGFPRSYRYAPQLRAWLRRNLHTYDGVVLHGMWTYPTWAAYRECQKIGKQYICFPHGMLEPWPVLGQGRLKAAKKLIYWRLRENEILRHGAAVLFTSQRESQLSQSTFSLPRMRRVVVPLAVSVIQDCVAKPDNPRIEIREGLKAALFLGRLHPKKNVAFLVRAWAESQPPDDWMLVLAGPGEPGYVQSLVQLIEELNLEGKVVLTGLVTGRDKAYLFQRSSWFLLPSSQENFGIAPLEAILYGCPVVLSDRVYLSEFLHDRSEILPLTSQAWTEFFRYRMGDEVRRQSLIDLDRRFVASRFEVDRVAREWALVLRDLFSA